MTAASRGAIDVVRTLARLGCPLQQQSMNGTALDIARTCGHPAVVRLLAAWGTSARLGEWG